MTNALRILAIATTVIAVTEQITDPIAAQQPPVIEESQPIHVLVWDERQPRQAEAYDNFLGNEIAERLRATDSAFEVRSVALDDAIDHFIDGRMRVASRASIQRRRNSTSTAMER